jgi:hypothetical protein
MWAVRYLPDAEQERAKLSARERIAVDRAVEKLQSLGPALGYPHSSDVRGVDRLRELRPRAGHSPTRPLYCRIDDDYVVAAIGPDGQSDARGFARACDRALERLEEWEQEQEAKD